MIAYLKQEDDVMVSTTTSTSANDWNTTSTTTQQSEKQRRRVLIHCYSPSRDIYIATPYNNNDSSNDDTEPNQKPSLLELKPNEISHTFNSSKVYPILESLMSRAEQTATVVTTQLQQKLLATQKVMHNANKIMTQNANTTSTNTSTPTDSAEENPATAIISSLSHNVSETTTKYIEDMTIEIENKSPMIEENLKNLITVVKDEEITILLQKCKHRLQQLLFLDNDDNADTTNNSKSNAEMSILQTLEKHSGVKIVFEHDDDDGDDDNEEEEVESDSKDASNTTKATSKTQMKKKKISISKSVKLSQQVAIKALEQVLLQQTDIAAIMNEKDITDMKDEIIQNFMNVFDTLQNVAQTDRVMHDLFDKYTSKTTTFYQNITGRLLQTKSANLFLDGATRLHTRAAAIFGNNPLIANNNNFGLNEIFNNLTKSFTEGDAALARLKSIELGDAVKNKLIHAIEIRSESLGGLDGIIAGALSNVVVTGKEINSNNNIQNLLNNLQQAASSAAMNAHETLISVLSSHSRYRDLALLRIEQTLCDLLLDNTNMIDDDDNDNDVGTFISGIIDDPERLAAIVQGEGGTAQIFEPIAKRAMKQIEQQLDVAEQHIINNTDNNIGPIGYDPALLLDGLKRVRKLMSGELTLSGLMEEIVNVLNDENVVAVGETLVQHGERVLDVLEGGANNASNLLKNSNHDTNKVVVEALQLVEKAGITKDVVMRELDQLNVNELLGTAESAVHDEKVRQQLLSSATDTALDFVLKILPSMPVPPFEGVKDGLLYTISNLSMEGFKVRKEDIRIDLAGIRATKSQDKKNSSKNNAQGQSNMNQSNHEDISGNVDYTTSTTTTSSIPIKATELLIIDIQRISTNLDNALWSFEQTYLPYLKGNGAAYIKMSGGAIRLQFELRKQRKRKKVDRTTSNTNDNGNGKESVAEEESWEPVLCLHDRTCTIAEVDLSLQGEGRLTWILNKLVTIFKGPLRDYVVRTIVRVLSNQSGWILKRFNTMLSPYWDLILRTAKLDMVRIDWATL